jgi:phage gp45-like
MLSDGITNVQSENQRGFTMQLKRKNILEALTDKLKFNATSVQVKSPREGTTDSIINFNKNVIYAINFSSSKSSQLFSR